MKTYFCIDLKTFYASVECTLRGYDPFETDLIVCDPARGKGSVCLAISPSLKNKNVKNRCRLYEIPKSIIPTVAKPRMKKYIEYSAKVYGIYLKYLSKEDIHVYSVDEAFLDVTSYLRYYKMAKEELAKKIMDDIYKETRITATCGIGTNLYLAKIALDIKAKHNENNMYFLAEEKYKKELWFYTPLTDFWMIGKGIANRLKKLNINNMHDISKCDEKLLYKELGINAKILIDHSLGIEPTTIEDIKKYKSKTKSISNNQILFKDYNYKDAEIILIEMFDNLTLELAKKDLVTRLISFSIGYSKDAISSLKVTIRLNNPTNSFRTIIKNVLNEYEQKIDKNNLIRRIRVSFSMLSKRESKQLDIFNYFKEEEKDLEIERTLNDIKEKYGKNSILRSISYLENANQRNRNNMIGGHNA